MAITYHPSRTRLKSWQSVGEQTGPPSALTNVAERGSLAARPYHDYPLSTYERLAKAADEAYKAWKRAEQRATRALEL